MRRRRRRRREFRGSVEPATAPSSSVSGTGAKRAPEIVYAEGVDPESIRPGSYEKYYFEKPVKEWIPAQKVEDYFSPRF